MEIIRNCWIADFDALLIFLLHLIYLGVVLPQLTAKEKPAMHVVGDVGGRIAIMVDDMLGNSKISDVSSFSGIHFTTTGFYISTNIS